MTAGDDPRRRDYAGANLEHWNTWTEIHEGSAFYDVEGFLADRQTLLRIGIRARAHRASLICLTRSTCSGIILWVSTVGR